MPRAAVPQRRPSPCVPTLQLGEGRLVQSQSATTHNNSCSSGNNNHWVTPTVTPRDVDIFSDALTPVQHLPPRVSAEHNEGAAAAVTVSPPRPDASSELSISEGLRPLLLELAAALEQDDELSCHTTSGQLPHSNDSIGLVREATRLLPEPPGLQPSDHAYDTYDADRADHADHAESAGRSLAGSGEAGPGLQVSEVAHPPESPAQSRGGASPAQPSSPTCQLSATPLFPMASASPVDSVTPVTPITPGGSEAAAEAAAAALEAQASTSVAAPAEAPAAASQLPPAAAEAADTAATDGTPPDSPACHQPPTPTSTVRRASFAPLAPCGGGRTVSGMPRASLASVASTASMLGQNLSHSFTHLVLGDDDLVMDKWDNDADLDAAQELAVRQSRSATMMARPGDSSMGLAASESGDASWSLRGASMRGSRKDSVCNKVHPEGVRMSAENSVSTVFPTDLLSEKRSTRLLLWGYFQALVISVLVAAICIPLVTALSHIRWHVESSPRVMNATLPPSSPPAAARDGPSPPVAPTLPYIIRPNQAALQWMLLAQLVFPLVIYSVLLYVCIRRTFKLPRALVGAVAFTLVWTSIACALLYRFDIAFWFYYIDLLMIVAAFVPCMAAVGWYVEADEQAPVGLRVRDTLVTVLLETIVAGSTLVYCLFLMPAFFMLTNGWLQVLWLCVAHPLYFEITTGFVVRKVLHRNRELGRNHIVYFLSIVHSVVHVVALATSLQASIEPVRVLALTVVLYNVSKLTWRSTVMQRDLLVEKLVNGWSFTYSEEKKADLARMVSVGIITEIILENASILITPYMMYRMYKEPIFMAVVPNTFFLQHGTYPIRSLILMIFIFMTVTITFDLLFYFLNYHTWQCLPLINTWRRIKAAKGWYITFLIYAFACMGVVFVFLTMMILPRAAFCNSNDYCDCRTPAYENICNGHYNSMMVDYIIDPYDN